MKNSDSISQQRRTKINSSAEGLMVYFMMMSFRDCQLVYFPCIDLVPTMGRTSAPGTKHRECLFSLLTIPKVQAERMSTTCVHQQTVQRQLLPPPVQARMSHRFPTVVTQHRTRGISAPPRVSFVQGKRKWTHRCQQTWDQWQGAGGLSSTLQTIDGQ